MPKVFCEKCGAQEIKTGDPFDDPKNATLSCPVCEELSCPLCEADLGTIEDDGERVVALVCLGDCGYRMPIKYRKKALGRPGV